MAPLELEGGSLGKKHQHYNKLVNEALGTNQPLEESQDDDIRNMLSIEIASKNRNVDYILNILKSEDQLLVSKAIKRSTWLITDPQYAHIINPEHLYTKLYPEMTSKAFNKLMLNIRLHLKDEKRVEDFYNYIKEKDIKSACKWLQHCSVPFVEIEAVEQNRNIPNHLALRLFEKSYSIFEAYITKWEYIMDDSTFLLRNHADKFLDILEKKSHFYLQFNAKNTKTVMEKCPQRILDKLEIYGKNLHIPTFVKYLKERENIKDFLLKHASNDKFQWMFTYENLQHFIKQIPKENRFEFVKKVFIDKEILTTRDHNEGEFMSNCAMSCRADCWNSQSTTNTYQWYKFAPFDLAFADLKKLIRSESVPEQRNLMLQMLLSCAGKNMQHIQTVLQYFHDKHINEPFKFKIQFINFFISKVDIHILDDKAWKTLSQLFHSMEVFIESENNVQSCIKAVIVRNSVRKQQVPDIIRKKFLFDTLKTIQAKLKKQEEKDAVFEYLRDFITTKANSLNLMAESEFNEAVTLCEHLLNLIKDWGKELQDHPFALDRIKELAKVKKEKNWSRDLSSLYNTKKSWRKLMFEESIALLPSEKVCVNALKHDSGLLSRNKEQVLRICCNDTISLRQLLSKIRIYWPYTLAEDYKTAYIKRLDLPNGHKAVIVGLCALLPQKEIKDLLKKYAPSDTKIDWNETNQLELSLQKQIAKNIHKTRSLTPVEEMLPYAKGDYLQYAVPSLNAILSQLSPNKSRDCIPKLLDAPVSLQKFGVRCAFHKLPSEELKPMFAEIWSSTKNSSIRTVIFTHTFDLLCKEKNTSQIKVTWDLLSGFIDKLTHDENKLVYKKLGEASSVPESIRPQFYTKCYTFLSSLPGKCNCESILHNMLRQASDIMEFLDNDFVVNVMLKKLNQTFTKEHNIYNIADVISSFILASRDEETQARRYEICLGTLLQKYLPLWDQIDDDKYRVKSHIKDILERLADNLSYTFEKKMQIPVKTFKTILSKLENSLSYLKDYVTLTLWKLMVTYVKILDETGLMTVYYKNDPEGGMTNEEKDKMYSEIHKQLAPLFAKECVQYIKEDLDRFGPSIHSLFAVAFNKVFEDYISRSICKLEDQMEYAISLLQYENEREVWLMVHQFLDINKYNIYSDSEKKKYEEIRVIAFSHPSDEIKMHYYELFADVVPFVSTTTS